MEQTLDGLLKGRIVVKDGTNALSLLGSRGEVLGIDNSKIQDIAYMVDAMYRNGIEPVQVSSGAVVEGMALNGLTERPSDVALLQALAAEGQPELVTRFRGALVDYGIGVMQMLLTHHNFQSHEERNNVKTMIESSFPRRKLALINNNDVVTNAELLPINSDYSFLDNDPLAAYVAVLIGADLLILVTEDGGLGTGGDTSKQMAIDYAERGGTPTRVVAHYQLLDAVRQQLERVRN